MKHIDQEQNMMQRIFGVTFTMKQLMLVAAAAVILVGCLAMIGWLVSDQALQRSLMTPSTHEQITRLKVKDGKLPDFQVHDCVYDEACDSLQVNLELEGTVWLEELEAIRLYADDRELTEYRMVFSDAGTFCQVSLVVEGVGEFTTIRGVCKEHAFEAVRR